MLDIHLSTASLYLLISITSPLILIVSAPLFAGLVAKFRAKFEARKGPSIFQPYYDLRKLLTKDVILPESSSWIFRVFPYLALAITVALCLLVPVFSSLSIFSYFSDLIFIFALFVIVAFFMVLSSVDAGTSFAGLGSSREAFNVALIEPVILLIILSLSIEFGTSNLFSIVAESIHGFELLSHPNSFFIAIAFLIVILVEAKRFPVDNPSTHLELTMIHEALLLEYSGKYLAMMEYASMLKFTILSSLFFSLFFSYGMVDELTLVGLAISILLWLVKMTAFAFVIALFEKSTAKLRLFRVPELVSFALVLALIAVFSHYYIKTW